MIMATKQPVPIKDILKTTILNTTQQEAQQKIQSAWEGIVGKRASKHAQPRSFKKSVLDISVDSPVWIYQLNTKRHFIEEQLTKQLSAQRKITIKLRAGEI